jgi:hypothetical protein
VRYLPDLHPSAAVSPGVDGRALLAVPWRRSILLIPDYFPCRGYRVARNWIGWIGVTFANGPQR